MRIGVTGTREGMNSRQREQIQEALHALAYEASCDGVVPHFHHGDCKGVDVEAAAIARELGFVIVSHPPVFTETRGYYGGDIEHGPKGYLERDRDIVDACDLLLVVPLQDKWQPTGGTWYTHDYAVRVSKPIKMFYPNK